MRYINFSKLIQAFILAFAFFISNVDAQAQNLPLQTGDINDYAAVLGGKPQREPLQTLINQLQKQHQVSLILLLSERDPFGDPERYASEIRRTWQINDPRTIFALFLETNFNWTLHLWAGSDLQDQLSYDVRNKLENQINTAAQRGRIRPATQQLGQKLLDIFEKGALMPSSESPSSNWMMPTAYTFSGLMLFWGVIRWARSYCPHCVKRLHQTRRGGKKLRHCSNCGYNR